MTQESEGFRRPRAAMAVLSLVLFLTFVDNTIVSVSLSDIQDHLSSGVSALQWVIGGYALAFASLMLIFGTLGDLFGRRRVMAIGIVIFCAGSLVAALAPSVGVLIAGRIIMGVGAAATEPGTLSMIRHGFPQRAQRDRALGQWAAVSGLALAGGPVLGGLLVAVWSFRAVFVFNLLLGGIALAGVLAVLPEHSDPGDRRIDAGGSVLGTMALAAATAATIEGEVAGYGAPWIIGLFAVAVVAAAAFWRVERRAPRPVLDLQYFRVPVFASANAVAFTAYFSTFAVFFFVPLYLVEVGSESGYRVAVTFVPLALAMIVAAALSGRWVARSGPRVPMVVGCLASGLGVLLTDVRLTPTAGPLAIGWTLALAGAGLGVVFVTVTSAVLAAVPAQRSGMAASATNTSREMGAVAGTAIFGSIINGQLTVGLSHRLAHLGVPAAIRSLVITGVSTGQNASDYGNSPQIAAIVAKVEQPAYAAFRSGVDISLRAGAVLLLLSAVAALRAREDESAEAHISGG